MARPSVVEQWISENPLLTSIFTKPALRAAGTVGAVAFRRVRPIIVALGVGYGVYQNIINYSKGGKDAVTRGGSGTGSGPGRVTGEYGKGGYWESIAPTTKAETVRLANLAKKSVHKQRIRFDGEYYYQFDPFHKVQKVHLHKYKHLSGNRYQLIENIDASTGQVIKQIKGAIEVWG
jgi:hypothetical protein